MTQSKKAFESMIGMLPNSDKFTKQELIDNTSIFWDFQEFVMNKFSISEKDTEDKFKEYVTDKMKGASPEDLSNTTLYIEHLGEYAKSIGFSEDEKLKKGFQYLVNIGNIIQND